MVLAAILVGCAGCGGGGTSSSADEIRYASDRKILRWSPPVAYQDNTPLNPSRDLAGYNIYIRQGNAAFSDSDVESAFVPAGETSVDLVPVCRHLRQPPGNYRVSVRAVAANGLMSDFSPSAGFSL